MKVLTALLLLIAITGCTTAEPRPGRVETVILEDGREVQVYVPGYSIEEFLCEFEKTHCEK